MKGINIKSIREFFKPTRVKVLLFICLTIIFYIDSTELLYFLSPGGGTNYLFLASIPPMIILIPFGILVNFVMGVSNTIFFTMLIISSAIGGYLFSCFIISLYKYFGKFKHNKFIRVLFVIVILILFIPLPIQESYSPVARETTIREFQWNCEELCESEDLFKYCTYYFEKYEIERRDWNENGVKNEIVKIGNQDWPACESRVYCFLTVPCKKLDSTQREVIEKCSKLLCDNYLEKYEGSVEYASEAVLRDIKISNNITECNFSEVPEGENWYKRFFPENVCEKYKKE